LSFGYCPRSLKKYCDQIALDQASVEQIMIDQETALAHETKWRLVHLHKALFGIWPRLFPPISFNEHILHRIIYDRDPRLKVICDKVALREFVQDRAGRKYIVPLFGIFTHPNEIGWHTLPEKFVLKPSHGSGSVRIVDRSLDLNKDEISKLAEQWLAQDYFDVTLEWGYRGIPRRILVEPFLQSPTGTQALEIEIYTFAGRAALINLIKGMKDTPDRRHAWFDATGRRIQIDMGYLAADIILQSGIFRSAVELAECIAADFSSLRVDLYLTGDGLKIGELTPYTNAGRTMWNPRTLDELLGMLWKPDFDLALIPDFTEQTV
jgi:TupA-like ATPgrasp